MIMIRVMYDTGQTKGGIFIWIVFYCIIIRSEVISAGHCAWL